MKFKTTIRIAALPLAVLIILLLFIAVWKLIGLPNPTELLKLIEDYYTRYGYWVVFIGALVEGMLIINWYFPGSAIVTLGVIFSRVGPLNPILVVGLATIAFFIAYMFSYAVGRYGWYKAIQGLGLRGPLEKTRKRVGRYGPKAILISYIHPNIGALTATSCGILFVPFSVFLVYSAVAVLIWNTFWGVSAYIAGPIVLEFMNLKYAILIIIIWLIIRVVRSYFQPSKKTAENNKGPVK